MTPLHHIGEFLRGLFVSVPLEAVRAVFVAVPVVLLVWVLTLPRSRTTPPGGGGLSGNLKLWAAAALVVQIVLYACFAL